MKRIAQAIIGIAILAMGLFSCTDSKERAQLQRIEKMMDGNPDADSAMMLLKNFDSNALYSEKDRAYYALLMTQAKDKTYEDVTNDSLISIAVNYYSHSDDTYHNMLSQYYFGQIKYNVQDYPQSIVAMFKALECATDLDNKFWMAMTCRSLAKVYNDTYNAAEEVVYAEKAYQYFKDSGKQPYINYAIDGKATAYNNIKRYDDAIKHAMQCVDSAKAYNDPYLYIEAYRIIGKSYLEKNCYSEAIDAFSKVCENKNSACEDLAFLGLAHIYYGNVSEALSILEKIPDSIPFMKNILKYRIYAKTDSTKKALAAVEKVNELNNDDFQKRIGTNITSSVVDYFRLNKEAAEAQNKASRTLLWLMVVISILISLILAIVVYAAYTYYQKQQDKIEQNIEIAQQLKEALMTKEAEYLRARGSMKLIMSTNLKKLDEMCRRIFENGDTDVARKHISDSVNSIITQIKSDPNVIKMLEDFVDLHRSNLISDFKADLPGLPETYNKLFLFSVLSFSDNTIVLFMDKKNVTQIYNYRRHLKDKIKQLDESKRNKYLAFL